MKKIMLLTTVMVAFCSVSLLSFGQITNLRLAKDSSVTINDLYTGMLICTNFGIENGKLCSFGSTNFRTGVEATYQPARWISFKGRGFVQLTTGQEMLSKYQFWTQLTPTRKLQIEVGSFTTLPTEQRPNPVTGSGQFETWSEGCIVPGTLNAKIKYQFGKNFQAGAGVALRDGLPEYSGMINLFNKVKISGWYTESIKRAGGAASLTTPGVYSCLVWKDQQVVADFLKVRISKKINLSLYSDMGYQLDISKLVRGEWGVLKNFDSKLIKGLFGMGYQYETHSIVTSLFIHD